VKIAETYLVEDEAVDAEAFVNRASGLMEAVTDYWVQVASKPSFPPSLPPSLLHVCAALSYLTLPPLPPSLPP